MRIGQMAAALALYPVIGAKDLVHPDCQKGVTSGRLAEDILDEERLTDICDKVTAFRRGNGRALTPAKGVVISASLF